MVKQFLLTANHQGKSLFAKTCLEYFLKVHKVVTLGTLDADSKIIQLTKDYPNVTFEKLDKYTIKCTRND